MVRAVLVESPIEKAGAAGGYEKEQTAQPHGDRPGTLAAVAFVTYLIIRVVAYPLRMIARAERAISHSIKAAFVPRPPSLVVFPSVAVAATLFMGLAMSIMSAQVTGDISSVLGGVLLVVVSLPIALVTAIFLSFVVPARAYAHPSAVVAVLSSYSPYVLGALTGVYGALSLGKMLPFDYESVTGVWRWTIAVAAPVVWLMIGLLSNHLASLVERRRQSERGMDELRESRHRIMVASEATRKSVAELLHGRVQGRMVVLGHWLSQCQAQLKDGPPEVVESLENANKLLKEIRDQELRTITRQLYPSIIRTGLPTALNSLADRFRSVFEIQVDIDDDMSEMDGPMRPRLGESLRLTLYRVAEEALGNVAKHSYADRASVSLSLAPSEELVLEVQDNGRGYEQSEAHRGLAGCG